MSTRTTISSTILIVGGGAAGMSAALAASSNGIGTTIIDDNPRLGGQIWRAELGRTASPKAHALIDAIENEKIHIVNDAVVFAAPRRQSLLAETRSGTVAFDYEKLIITTGARERFLPFPGWTLPNVLGAGGLQALVKGGLSLKGKRIVVAGTGPLLLAVAKYLRSKGAKVSAIVEQAPQRKLNRFALNLVRSPRKLFQAAALRASLLGIPYLANSWVTEVKCRSPRVSKDVTSDSTMNSLLITLNRNGKAQAMECDYLACGFHLVPNTELVSLLGCDLTDGLVDVDEFQLTSRENVYCAGEPTGIGGVESSLIEGAIAGHAAAGNGKEARALFQKRDRTRNFGVELNTAFALRHELRHLSDPQTVVCRCEDVQYEKLAAFGDWRTAKLQTRCGMGPCQGRVCGAAVEFIFGWTPDSVRPPIFPVKLENL